MIEHAVRGAVDANSPLPLLIAVIACILDKPPNTDPLHSQLNFKTLTARAGRTFRDHDCESTAVMFPSNTAATT